MMWFNKYNSNVSISKNDAVEYNNNASKKFMNNTYLKVSFYFGERDEYYKFNFNCIIKFVLTVDTGISI